MSPRRINRLTAVLLVGGLGAALAIHVLAPPEPPEDPWRSDPRAERRYRRELAMYGGKANVLSAEFLDWLDDRWHGRALATTVGALTLGGVAVFRFVACRRP